MYFNSHFSNHINSITMAPPLQRLEAGGFFTNEPPRKAQNFLTPKLICDSGGFIFIVSTIYAV